MKNYNPVSLPLVALAKGSQTTASWLVGATTFNFVSLPLVALAMALAKGGQTIALWLIGSQTTAFRLVGATTFNLVSLPLVGRAREGGNWNISYLKQIARKIFFVLFGIFLISTPAFAQNTYNLTLTSGDNFISLPLTPQDKNITTILAPIITQVKDVWEFDPLDVNDPWKHYQPGLEEYSDLKQMDAGRGYWINLKRDITLQVTGTPIPENALLNLKPGWNIIAWPYQSSQAITAALSALNFGTDYTQVSRFNPTTKAQENFLNQPASDDFSTFESGKSYYIYMLVNKTIRIGIAQPVDATAPVTIDHGIDGLWHNNPVTVTLNALDLAVSAEPDAYTKLLLRFDGADGSAAFVDDSGKIVTANGNAQISTAQSKFGGSSVRFNGNGDYLAVPNSADWNFGSGDFAIDFWMRRNGLSTWGGLVSTYTSANSDGWYIRLDLGGTKIQFVNPVTLFAITSSIEISDLIWTHVAIVRNGNTVTMYFNGVNVGSGDVTGISIDSIGAGMVIGRLYTDYSNLYFNGWLDELRVTKGLARWTADFTPPSDFSSGVSKTYYSKDGSSPNILYANPFALADEGIYTIKYYSIDNAGNIEAIKTASKQVKIDKTPPTGALTINNSDAATGTLDVTLNLTASDSASGMGQGAQVQFSNDNSTWSAPESYAAAKAWALTAGDGTKTVYAKFKDAAGNWSNTASDTIILDTLPPVIVSFWPPKDSLISSQGGPITLNIVFGDSGSGIDLLKTKLFDENNTDITTQAEASANNIQFIITAPIDKKYTFKLYLEDKAGNNLTQDFSFTVDSTIPTISVDTIGGTFDAPFTVKLQASENGTIYYSTDGYPPIEGNANTTAVAGTAANVAINKTTNLQFFTIDTAGNRSQTKAETYRFNNLPTPASGLQGSYNETQKRVDLQWQSASGANGYYVYRASNIQEMNLLKDSNTRKYPGPTRLKLLLPIGNGNFSIFITTNSCFDDNVQSGTTYWYGVSVNINGFESPVSELISVKVPEQPPAITRKEAAKRALAWIEANQKPQGYWGDKKEIQMLATSQILNALSKVYNNNPSNIWVYRSLFWLRGSFADNNDYLARKILTLFKFKQNVDEEVNRLLSEGGYVVDNTNHVFFGWGVQRRYQNDALTSALGSLAIVSWRPWNTSTNDQALGYLLSSPLKSADGRFGWVPGKDASISVSSLVYNTINRIKSYTVFSSALDKNVYQWILDSQNPDGSFGKGIIDTAAVLLWIPLDDAVRLKAKNYLVSQQGKDGSWNNHDAYVTGLCLEAILPLNSPVDWNADW